MTTRKILACGCELEVSTDVLDDSGEWVPVTYGVYTSGKLRVTQDLKPCDEHREGGHDA